MGPHSLTHPPLSAPATQVLQQLRLYKLVPLCLTSKHGAGFMASLSALHPLPSTAAFPSPSTPSSHPPSSWIGLGAGGGGALTFEPKKNVTEGPTHHSANLHKVSASPS